MAVLGVLVARAVAAPVDPYGSNGAAWMEHLQRLNAAWELPEALPPGGEFMHHWLARLDGGFPPMLHLLAVPLTWLTRGSLLGVLPLTLGLLLVLAGAVGRIAYAITDRPPVGAGAFAGVMLVPGLHGSAIRYYYDLPMTALLWAALAVLVSRWDQEPVRAGLVGAGLALAASFTKWTTLPFLLCLVAGAALTPRRLPGALAGLRNPGARGKALLVWGLAWLIPVGLYVLIRGQKNSLGFSARESGVVNYGHHETGGFFASVVGGIGARLGELPFLLEKLGDYGLGLTVAVFSPLLLAPTLVLLGIAAARRAPGGWLVASAVFGHIGFLVLLVDPVDERFLITLAPALVLGAAVGWGTLSPGRRRLSGVVIATLGLLVAADLHHGVPLGPNSWARSLPLWGTPGADPMPPPIRPRGISAASSSAHRGWARRDAALDPRQPMRDALQDWLRGCAPTKVAALDAIDLIAPYGDHDWITWSNRRWCMRDEDCVPLQTTPVNWRLAGNVTPPPGVRAVFFLDDPSFSCEGADLAPDTLVLSIERFDGRAQRAPPCPTGEPWHLVALVPDPEGGPGVGAWARAGTEPCSRGVPPSPVR